jgi:hypothetical protein
MIKVSSVTPNLIVPDVTDPGGHILTFAERVEGN